MMHVDGFTTIGRSRKTCEDYVILKEDHVILSDGCSNSPNTDVGARLLAHSMDHLLSRIGGECMGDMPGTLAIHDASLCADILGLESRCLDATLLYIAIDRDRVCVTSFGDGNVICLYRNGKVSCCNTSYSHDAPAYLSYRGDKVRREAYQQMGGDVFHRISSREPGGAEWQTDDFGAHKSSISRGGCIMESVSEIRVIMVASDGIESFRDQAGNQVPLHDVINEIVDFRHLGPGFLQRRMGSSQGVIDAFARIGITHTDDISIAGFCFED